MNGRDAQRLIARVNAVWPGRSIVGDDAAILLDTWARVLADIELAEAEAALLSIINRGDPHPPSLPVLLDQIWCRREQDAGVAAPSLDLALAEVRHYVRVRGLRHGPPDEWSHPAVASAVRALGWDALCEADSTVRAHFIRVYNEARDQHRARVRGGHALDAGHTLRLPSPDNTPQT